MRSLVNLYNPQLWVMLAILSGEGMGRFHPKRASLAAKGAERITWIYCLPVSLTLVINHWSGLKALPLQAHKYNFEFSISFMPRYFCELQPHLCSGGMEKPFCLTTSPLTLPSALHTSGLNAGLNPLDCPRPLPLHTGNDLPPVLHNRQLRGQLSLNTVQFESINWVLNVWIPRYLNRAL